MRRVARRRSNFALEAGGMRGQLEKGDRRVAFRKAHALGDIFLERVV
jgi:hypothetical protein